MVQMFWVHWQVALTASTPTPLKLVVNEMLQLIILQPHKGSKLVFASIKVNVKPRR